MIDAHCHIDLYKNPLAILQECDEAGITILAMTNLPSHFAIGYQHVLPFKKTRLALGLHPLCADQHKNEISLFKKYISRTSYVGEVGLDFSREGYNTKEIQLKSFKTILAEVAGKKKILSLHSRRAEREVFDLLVENSISNAIFHWYSGPVSLISKIAGAGYFFSINSAMIKSESGRKIIEKIPIGNLLTETDGPFIEVEGRPSKPTDLILVYKYLSDKWGGTIEETDAIISQNFQRLLSKIRS